MQRKFYGKFSHSANEYWDTFSTFMPLPENIYNIFAFLHDSEHVLILIFESGKKCQK